MTQHVPAVFALIGLLLANGALERAAAQTEFASETFRSGGGSSPSSAMPSSFSISPPCAAKG